MTADFHEGNLTTEEMRSVLATILKISPGEIEDYLVIVKQPCAKCGRQYCGDGPISSTGSRYLILPDGTAHREPAFELHLAAAFIDTLAEDWEQGRG